MGECCGFPEDKGPGSGDYLGTVRCLQTLRAEKPKLVRLEGYKNVNEGDLICLERPHGYKGFLPKQERVIYKDGDMMLTLYMESDNSMMIKGRRFIRDGSIVKPKPTKLEGFTCTPKDLAQKAIYMSLMRLFEGGIA